MNEVKLYDSTKRVYRLTTEHPASSHRQPVLVDDHNQAYGPGDTILDRHGERRLVHAWMSDSLFLADPAQQDCDTIKAFNRLGQLT